MLFAYAQENYLKSYNSHLQLIEYFSNFDKWLTDILPQTEEKELYLTQCQFILVIENRVWQFTDFYIREVKEGEVSAIGSGSYLALMGAKLSDSVKDILEAVCETDIYCGKPIKIIEVKI